MSELKDARAGKSGFRVNLLATASALALTAQVASAGTASAEDADRPTVWIELGGQMDLMQGMSDPFTAPFMSLSPTPGPYQHGSFVDHERPPHHAFGLDGRILLQPEHSDWTFSVALRYGRSQTNRHVHNQTAFPPFILSSNGATRTFRLRAAPFADTKTNVEESHAVLDFSAGRDVGVGMFGQNGSSVLGAGVRYAQFSLRSAIDIHARPSVIPQYSRFLHLPKYSSFNQYNLSGHASRSFHGIGPSLSWEASAVVLGNAEDGELALDWSVNASVLFGRQKAKTDHNTQAYYKTARGSSYPHLYTPRAAHSTRSRSVTVPNLGGFAGFSVKYPDAKITLGYRADFFFSAVDAGIDQRDAKTLGFNGPYASISIGFGG